MLEATFLTFIIAPKFGWYVMEIGATLYGLGAGSYMSRMLSHERRRKDSTFLHSFLTARQPALLSDDYDY